MIDAFSSPTELTRERAAFEQRRAGAHQRLLALHDIDVDAVDVVVDDDEQN